MRIAVVGAGGVGGGFGAALAKAGADVTFIARGAHLAAMKSDGLQIESPRGDTHRVGILHSVEMHTADFLHDRAGLAKLVVFGDRDPCDRRVRENDVHV